MADGDEHPTGVLLEARDLVKVYDMGAVQVRALDGVSFTIDHGEVVAIVGSSGSGKSTLLSILGCLDRPTSGEYVLEGSLTSTLPDDTLSDIRSQKIGFVFQSYHLVASLSAVENVELPLFYQGVHATERHRRATALLDRLGLGDRLHHYPEELSGGQKQRAAIARALAADAPLLLADEPTGNLDSSTGAETLELLFSLADLGKTLLLVTHDLEIAGRAPRTIKLSDGKVQSDERRTAVAP
jgi:putative ABC transport system ATP-binding protein